MWVDYLRFKFEFALTLSLNLDLALYVQSAAGSCTTYIYIATVLAVYKLVLRLQTRLDRCNDRRGDPEYSGEDPE